MRLTVLMITLTFLAACSAGEKTESVPNAQATQVSVAPEAEIDSGQARALDAGRSLIGKNAPAATLKTIDGEQIDLAKLYGKRPIYLKFWATWCVPCREQMPAFVKDHAKFGRDMTVVAVNTGFNETDAAIRNYRREHGLTMPIVVDDGTLAGALNLRVTPQHVVIGRDGRIAYVGHLEDENLQRALTAAIAAPATSSSATSTETAAASRTEAAIPPLPAVTLDGRRVAVGGTAAKPRAIVFMSPWCESYFKDSRPQMSASCTQMRKTVAQLSAQPGVEWLGVASGLWATAGDLKDYQREKQIAIPLTLDADGAIFRRFAVRDVPTAILIDRDGSIIGRFGAEPNALAGAIAKAVRS